MKLREALPAGKQYRVTSRVDLHGSLTLAAEKTQDKKEKTISITGNSLIEYDERVLDGDSAGPVAKTLRQYRRVEFKRKVGEQPQASGIRPEVRRMVLLKHGHAEVPFSPDGPLLWGEIDLVRTDVFTPAVVGLLPAKEVRVGDSWEGEKRAVAELTDLENLDGKLVCKLQEVVVRNAQRFASISFAGTVTGTNEDGPNRQQIDGSLYFDLQSQHISYLSISGTSWLLDEKGQARGKIDGRYVLTREPRSSDELGDASLRGVKLDPTPENTLLLFSEPTLGVQFVYPRRWSVQRADARQLVLEAQGGGGLVITLEPLKQVPTGVQFEAEARRSLQQQKGRVVRSVPPARLDDGIERFAMEAEIDRRYVFLDYYVVRQQAGGATAAGQYPLPEANAMTNEAAALLKSLRLIPPRR
jgi:hypothetical protein